MKAYLIALGIVLCFGCSAHRDLRGEYLTNARKVGIVPIYPPREEFQVGDVFLGSVPSTYPNGDQNDVAQIWIGEIPEVKKLAEQFMDSRIVFQATGPDPETAVTGASSSGNSDQKDTFGYTLSRRSEVGIQTLPAAEFPSFSADAGFTAGSGIANLLSAVGLAGGARTRVLLQFNDVRTYWVENIKVIDSIPKLEIAEKAIAMLPEWQGSSVLANDLCKELKKNTLAGGHVQRDPQKRQFRGFLVTRVYLTRKITYTYSNNQIIATGIRRAEAGSKISDVPLPKPVTVNITNSSGPVDASVNDAELTALRDQIDSFTANGSQGSGLTFQGWDALGLSFNQTFPRPVAIGYEAIDFKFGAPPSQKTDAPNETQSSCDQKQDKICNIQVQMEESCRNLPEL